MNCLPADLKLSPSSVQTVARKLKTVYASSTAVVAASEEYSRFTK